MKLNFKNIFGLFVLVTLTLESCMRVTDGPTKTATVDDIDYSQVSFTNFTTEDISIKLTDSLGSAFSGVKIILWDNSPLENGQVILKGFTDEKGQFQTTYNFPSHIQKVIMETGYIGIPDYLVLSVAALADGVVVAGHNHDFDVLDDQLIPNQSQAGATAAGSRSNARVAANPKIQTIGSYNWYGKPYYLLSPRDNISADLLEKINASLPERKPVPQYHPSYLEGDSKINLDVVELADVYMTFVSEGAGYLNSLGYYTYETGNPPSSIDDIETIYVGFPNASLYRSGGSLNAGDKILLGQFPAGTSIGFVILADGWNSRTFSVKDNATAYYSDKTLNPELDENAKQHAVTLFDEDNELFLIGFEDLYRDQGSDEDFNDAIFYITSNPVTAISRENVKPVDKPGDTDNDGVTNVYDEFPDNADYAYTYSYPSDGSYGTFAFEDKWPSFGDYDFNDMVVDYRFTQYANAENKVAKMDCELVLKAVGASFQNGFGFALDLDPSKINKTEGQEIFGNTTVLQSNGTESGQSKAVIIASDNLHQSFGTFGLINTIKDGKAMTPDTVKVSLTMTAPVASSELGYAPFNPFAIINQQRGMEVHLPGYPPTELADRAVFGTSNDNTDLAKESYYRSKEGLPWAMNLPVSFAYPLEGQSVTDAYIHFNQWAKSYGFSYMDWYINKEGYRDNTKIYP